MAILNFDYSEFEMKKYTVRFLVAILAFCVGTATIYFFAWDKIKTLNPYRETHSAENNSPYSILEGTTVRIKPYNATFEIPVENCVAHVGDKGWGNHFWNDLQGRVYVTDLTPEEVAARVEKQGLAKASEVFERADVKYGSHGNWERRTLDILDAPSWSDFMLGEGLDFYYRPFGNKTVVVVFLHTDRFEKEINLILDSFKWSNES